MADNDYRTLEDTTDVRVLSGYDDPTSSNPQIMLRVSQDGGLSWGEERLEPVGQAGQTKWRVIYRRLGSARDPVFELSGTDPVKVAIIGAFLNADEGIS